MKKILLLIIIFTLCIFIFAACDETEETFNDSFLNSPEEEIFDEQIDNEENEIIYEEDKSILSLGNVNIRLTPTTSENNIIGLLKNYERVTYLYRYNQNWYCVVYNGETAYITTNPLHTRIVDDFQDEREEIIESIIAAGMTQLAIPYEFGSTRLLNYNGTLNPYFTGKTFDCSAFVQYAFYIGAGIKLKGDSRSQSVEGLMIKRQNLQRGDLIFMTTPARQYNTGVARIGHVVIYLGNNQILHTHGAGGVKLDTLTGVWDARYEHARRML